jgi:RNA ligase
VITNAKLLKYQEQGLVHGSRHSTLPLTVWCYTRKAQYERAWDEVTTGARGLVTHDDGRVIGRGFPKFFAAGDPIASLPDEDFYAVFDKVDGTLIHVTEFDGELLVWTKGSFDTPHVSAALPYLNGWRPKYGTTTLFEGVFGFNRVVVDYNAFRGLVLLGEVEVESGKDWTHPEDVASDTGWAGETATDRTGLRLDYLTTICSDPTNGENREGFVIVFPRENAPAHRLKVKFDWYLKLHKMMTHLTPRRIHEAYLGSLTSEDGEGLWEAFLDQIPDEMDSATQTVVEAILSHSRGLCEEAERAVTAVSDLTERRDIAKAFSEALDPTVRGLAFLILDGRRDDAWVQAAKSYPAGIDPIMAVQDDE